MTPINPTIEEIDGIEAFPSLTAYARERGAPDVVDVFRKPSELVGVVQRSDRRRREGDLVSVRRRSTPRRSRWPTRPG